MDHLILIAQQWLRGLALLLGLGALEPPLAALQEGAGSRLVPASLWEPSASAGCSSQVRLWTPKTRQRPAGFESNAGMIRREHLQQFTCSQAK